jgi:arylformamidase
MRIDPELESHYNNMARRPDAAEVIQQLSDSSATYRDRADASLDCRYGDHPRECIDIFRCGKPSAPLYVYVHGGYWQRGDKSIYSYLAQTFNAAGVDVAIIGYPLCPDVSMTAVVASIRNALAWLYRNAAGCGLNSARINLSGHSAGGHLSAMAMTTRWSDFASDLPADLLKSAIPISGLYLLEPLRPTTIGEVLHLTDAETSELSPALLQAAHAAPMLAITGGAETPAFFSQADSLVDSWSRPGFVIEQHIEPQADHFDVVVRLASGDSEIFRRILAWLR